MAAIKEHRDAMHHGPDSDAKHDREQIERLPYEVCHRRRLARRMLTSDQLIDVMKTWHKLVAASKHGAMNGLDSDTTRVILDGLMDEQGLSEQEKKELLADPESRKMLFWNGYESMLVDLTRIAIPGTDKSPQGPFTI